MGPEAPPVSGHRAASSSSSDSVLERSDELATRRLGQESLKSEKKDENDPLADLPLWLEDFTDNLEPAEVHAPAHISQDSDSEHPTKVATKSRKHSIFTHFPKDRDYDVCLKKITKASCRRRTGEAPPRAEKFGDLITADHKSLMKDVNHETIIDMLSWYRISPLKGFNPIRAKQRLSGDGNVRANVYRAVGKAENHFS